uniref:Uncharacterized protein n=1 Tax=Octopus bimaculoides TaxID=37653 RepID=A0A0L8IEZ8_OCTBM
MKPVHLYTHQRGLYTVAHSPGWSTHNNTLPMMSTHKGTLPSEVCIKWYTVRFIYTKHEQSFS